MLLYYFIGAKISHHTPIVDVMGLNVRYLVCINVRYYGKLDTYILYLYIPTWTIRRQHTKLQVQTFLILAISLHLYILRIPARLIENMVFVAKKVAVIGAGVSGLTSARHLKAAGLDVVVFERSSVSGGVWCGPFWNIFFEC